MGTMILKCTAILALVMAAALKPTINLQLLLGFVVCAAGAAVAAQAVRAKKYVWAIAFVSIAIFFNPVLTFQPPYSRHIGISALCVAAFGLSLVFLQNLPTKTIASITEQHPESESL
jgi:uncharacterized membrane protein YccC